MWKKLSNGPPFGSFSMEKWKSLISCQNDQWVETIIFCKLDHFWAALWTKKNFPSQNRNFENGVIVKISKSFSKSISGCCCFLRKMNSRPTWDTPRTPSRHPTCTLLIPSRHTPDIHKAPTKFHLCSFNRSERNYDSGGWVAQAMWWVAQAMWWRVAQAMWWSHVHFIATSCSNLQDCKISNWVEIPKLDRVWQ